MKNQYNLLHDSILIETGEDAASSSVNTFRETWKKFFGLEHSSLSPKDCVSDLISDALPVNSKLAHYLKLRDQQGLLLASSCDDEIHHLDAGQAVVSDLLPGDLCLVYSPSCCRDETHNEIVGYYLAIITSNEDDDGNYDALIIDPLEAKLDGFDSNVVYINSNDNDRVYVLREAFDPNVR